MKETPLMLKWLEALESGKYSQCKKYLRTDSGYCCLGVLKDIVDPDKWIFKFDHYENGEHTALLSTDILNSAGVSYDDQYILMYMNDEGKSFKEIAQYIRSQL